VLAGNRGFDAGPVPLDSTRCGTLLLIDPPDAGSNLTISALSLSDVSRNYSILPPLPTFPYILHPGDTVPLNVCFHPRDTGAINEEVQLWTACNAAYTYRLTGFGLTGVLLAADHSFEPTPIGTERCASIRIRNVGSSAITVLGASLSDSTNFSIDTAVTAPHYPMPILAGSSVLAAVCYMPTDVGPHSCTISWQTDMDSDALVSSKPTTMLDSSVLTDDVDTKPSVSSNVLRAFLVDSHLTVYLPSAIRGSCDLRLYDVLGRVVASWHITSNVGEVVLATPAGALGSYFLVVTSPDGSQCCTMVR
jgi:hypothetical protein